MNAWLRRNVTGVYAFRLETLPRSHVTNVWATVPRDIAFVRLTTLSGARMLRELRDGYLEPEFYKEYHKARRDMKPGAAPSVCEP